jgi:IS30 family transposase
LSEGAAETLWRSRTARTIPNQVSIEQRPAMVGTRERFGDWEADLIHSNRRPLHRQEFRFTLGFRRLESSINRTVEIQANRELPS